MSLVIFVGACLKVFWLNLEVHLLPHFKFQRAWSQVSWLMRSLVPRVLAQSEKSIVWGYVSERHGPKGLAVIFSGRVNKSLLSVFLFVVKVIPLK